MTMIASCGDEIKKIYYWIEYEDENDKETLWSMIVCPKCFRFYQKHFKLIRFSREENK
jgi:hypothetical protein